MVGEFITWDSLLVVLEMKTSLYERRNIFTKSEKSCCLLLKLSSQ